MGYAWLRIGNDNRPTGHLHVLVLDDGTGTDVPVELPWTDCGEPAGVFKRGQASMVPRSDLLFCETEPQIESVL